MIENVIMANVSNYWQLLQSEDSHKPVEELDNIINYIERLEQQRNMKGCK